MMVSAPRFLIPKKTSTASFVCSPSLKLWESEEATDCCTDLVRWIKWSLMFRHAMFRQSIPTCLWALCLMRFEMYSFFIFSTWDEMFLPLASTCQMQISHLSAVMHNLYHTKLYHTKRKYLTLWLKFGVGEKNANINHFFWRIREKDL